MNWSALWSGFIGSLPGVIASIVVSILTLQLTKRINQSTERLKTELQRDIVKFSKWHEKRIDAMIALYNAFSDFLKFLRHALYVENGGRCMDPMHEFDKATSANSLFLDDEMAEKVIRYQGELLEFWNWSVRRIAERGEDARDEIRQRLDEEVPAYLSLLRRDMNEYLDPTYEAKWTEPRLVLAAQRQGQVKPPAAAP